MPRREEARQGYMFSTANAMPGRLLQGGDAVDEVGGVVPLPAERRVHDDHVGADRGRHLGGALELAPRLGAPDPLGEQQARRVDRADRHLVVLGELLDRRGLLATARRCRPSPRRRRSRGCAAYAKACAVDSG